MPKYTITRIVMYNQSFDVEAESKDEAIEIAKKTSALYMDKEFLDTDYYQAELAEEDDLQD